MAEPIDSGAVETRIGFNYTGQAEFDRWDRALDKAERRKKVEAELGADFDERQFDAFDRALGKAEAKAKRRGAYQASLGADFDARAFNASERALGKWERDAAQAERASGRLGRTNRDLDSGLLSLSSRLPLVKWGTYAAGAAAAVPPTIALAGALGPLTGLLGAVPGLAAAAGGALLSGMLGLRGVGDALGASWDQQTQLAAGTVDTAKQAETATDAIRAAEERLGDSHRRVTDATDDLNDAREEARRRLVDMRLEAQRANLSEREGVLALREATKELLEIEADAEADAADRQRARLRVRDAELALTETRVEGTRAQRDYHEAERGGLRNMDEVVNARERLVDAEREVQRATDDVGRASRDAKEQLATAAGGSDKLAESMADLSPAGRAFVQLVESRFFPLFRRLRDEAQEGLLPGLGRGLIEAERSFPVLERMVGRYSDALGDAAEAHGKLFGSRAQARDFEQIFGQGERLIRRSADASLDWSRGLTHVAVAAEPILDWLGRINVRLGETFERWAQGGRESGRLEAFFERSTHKVETTVEALWDFGRGLINIGTIGARVWGDDMLKGIGKAAERFRDWTESVRGSRDIEGYFTRWRRRWGEISGAVGTVVRRYRELRREGEKPLDAAVKALAEAWSRALPVIAENVAGQAPEIAWAFIKGFLAADAWGKLAIGGWLIAKFGGAAAFLAIGRRIGGFLTAGIAAGGGAGAVAGGGAAAGAGGGLLGGLLSKLKGPAARAGMIGAGIFLADQLFGAFSKTSRERSANALESITELAQGAGGLGGAIEGIFGDSDATNRAEALSKALHAIAGGAKVSGDRARQLQREIDKLSNASDEGKANMRSLVNQGIRPWERGMDALSNRLAGDWRGINRTSKRNLSQIKDYMVEYPEEGRREVQKNMRLTKNAILDSMDAGTTSADQGMRAIRRAFTVHTRASKDTAKRNFDLAKDAIDDAVTAGVITAKRGTREIRRLFKQYLSDFGIRGREQEIYLGIDTHGGKSHLERGLARGGFVKAVRRAVGGFIGGPGRAGHDTVSMAAPEDSSVINRHQIPWLDAALQATGLGGVSGLLDSSMGGGSAGPMVPIIAGEGELLLDPSQTRLADMAMRVAGGGGLDALFAAINRPHYLARGGYVQGAVPPGGAAARQLAEEMFGKGFNVTSAYRSNSTTHHGSGDALDFGDSVNSMPSVWAALFPRRSQFAELFGPDYLPGAPAYRYGTPGGAVAGHEDHIHVAILSALKGALGRGAQAVRGALRVVAKKIRRQVVEGPPSPLKAGVQRGLDAARSVSQKRLDSAAGSISGGATGIGAGIGDPGGFTASRAQMTNWARTALHRTGHGASPTAINKLLTLAMKESSWNTHSINLWDSNAAAGNPSGGLMHVTIDKVGGTWPKDKRKLWDPVRNMMASIRYQFGRYGGLITHSPYAKGGRVGFAGGGRIRPGQIKLPNPKAPLRSSKGLNPFKKAVGNTLRRVKGGWGLDAITNRIDGIERDYEYEETRYETQDAVEDFVIPAEVDEDGTMISPPRLDMEALARKARSLQKLIGFQNKIVELIQEAKRIIHRTVRMLDEAMGRLRKARGGAKPKDRQAYNDLIKFYQGEKAGLHGDEKQFGDLLRFEKLDLETLQKESSGLWNSANESLAEAVDSAGTGGETGGLEGGEGGGETAGSSQEDINAAARQMFEAFTANREALFSDFGSNFYSDSPGLDPGTIAAGFRNFGAFEGALPYGSGAPEGAVPAGGGTQFNVVQNFAAPPTSPHLWTADLKHEVQSQL